MAKHDTNTALSTYDKNEEIIDKSETNPPSPDGTSEKLLSEYLADPSDADENDHPDEQVELYDDQNNSAEHNNSRPSLQTDPRRGSGAIAAGFPVPLTVSAADPKAFGALLDDISTGRVKVSFSN